MPFQDKRSYTTHKNEIEIMQCHSMRYPVPQGRKKPKEQRLKKVNITSKQQKEINNRNAEDTLRLSIMENFREDDTYLTLTYKNDSEEKVPPTPPEAETILGNFIRRIKRFYEKNGFDLKYIIITECKKIRIHHHMLMNAPFAIPIKKLKQLWGQGGIRKEPYQGEALDAAKIADYFIKEKHSAFYTDEKVFRQRWKPSRNLKKVKIKKKIVPAGTWRKTIVIPKGYYLDKASVRTGQTAHGYPYRFYRLIRIVRRI